MKKVKSLLATIMLSVVLIGSVGYISANVVEGQKEMTFTDMNIIQEDPNPKMIL